MLFNKLGKTKIDISSIIIGTWQAGRQMWTGIDDKETTTAIRKAVDLGINTIDTAEVYGNGYSEQIVAKATNPIRKTVVYATKVFCSHLKHDQVIKACHRSLRNLKTDYIDLYQIHWPQGSFGFKKVPVEETVSALNLLKEQGKIRAIGVSNFSLDEIKEALKYGKIESLQPPYSLFFRYIEKEIMPFCLKNNITILGYSSLAQGFLTGKFGLDHKFDKKDHRSGSKLFQNKNIINAVSKLKPIADKNNVSMSQLALAWVISHKNTCAIAGARNKSQVEENIKAVEVSIEKESLKLADAICKKAADFLDDDPVIWKD